jgi:hypothetical protein
MITIIEETIKGETWFYPVIEGEKQNVCAESEDMAMLLGLGIKYDGYNTKFPKMAAKMLGIGSVWAE